MRKREDDIGSESVRIRTLLARRFRIRKQKALAGRFRSFRGNRLAGFFDDGFGF